MFVSRVRTREIREDGLFSPITLGGSKDARNKTTLAIEMLLAGEAEALTRRAVELVLEATRPPCARRAPCTPGRFTAGHTNQSEICHFIFGLVEMTHLDGTSEELATTTLRKQ